MSINIAHKNQELVHWYYDNSQHFIWNAKFLIFLNYDESD